MVDQNWCKHKYGYTDRTCKVKRNGNNLNSRNILTQTLITTAFITMKASILIRLRQGVSTPILQEDFSYFYLLSCKLGPFGQRSNVKELLPTRQFFALRVAPVEKMEAELTPSQMIHSLNKDSMSLFQQQGIGTAPNVLFKSLLLLKFRCYLPRETRYINVVILT